MKKLLAFIFALMISLTAFAMIACEKPDNDDQPEYVKIDAETFASAIEAYGDLSSYVGVQGYKFDLDFSTEMAVAVTLPLEQGGQTAISKDRLDISLSSMLNYADLSDVEFSLNLDLVETITTLGESAQQQGSMNYYLYDEGFFADVSANLEGAQRDEKERISDFTNDLEGVLEKVMPLPGKPPYVGGITADMTPEQVSARLNELLDRFVRHYYGVPLEDLLVENEIAAETVIATVVMGTYLEERLEISYNKSLGHYVLEANIPEAVTIEQEGATVILPAINYKVELYANENRITNFTVACDFAVESNTISYSMSFGETAEKIVKPINPQDYVEVSGEGESILAELKSRYDSFMSAVNFISPSRDKTLDFYASMQYDVTFMNQDYTAILSFLESRIVCLDMGFATQHLEIQIAYSSIIIAADRSGNAAMFVYYEATEEEPAHFMVYNPTTLKLLAVAYPRLA
ncbi:MAG: hypothetical protein IKC48_04785 [Clostridia bacterium]|nr:hypothetical protein [Clostridia bacterium]